MGWSYSGDPNGSSKDAVRFLLQDTNTNKQIVQDEEIEFALATEMNIYTAAALICTLLVSKSGGISHKKIEDFAITYDVGFYVALAGQLQARGAGHQIPYCGGISISDKAIQENDSDAAVPSFRRGLDNNPEAPGPSNASDNDLNNI